MEPHVAQFSPYRNTPTSHTHELLDMSIIGILPTSLPPRLHCPSPVPIESLPFHALEPLPSVANTNTATQFQDLSTLHGMPSMEPHIQRPQAISDSRVATLPPATQPLHLHSISSLLTPAVFTRSDQDTHTDKTGGLHTQPSKNGSVVTTTSLPITHNTIPLSSFPPSIHTSLSESWDPPQPDPSITMHTIQTLGSHVSDASHPSISTSTAAQPSQTVENGRGYTKLRLSDHPILA